MRARALTPKNTKKKEQEKRRRVVGVVVVVAVEERAGLLGHQARPKPTQLWATHAQTRASSPGGAVRRT
jgi:hypothetical protein